MRQAQTLTRRMLAFGLLAACLLLTATHASAQNVTIRGSGTCQAYLDAKHSGDVNQAVSQLTWLLGYMSGLAVARQVNVMGTADSADSMLIWVDTYCGRFPQKYLSDAGDLYYRFRIDQMKAQPKTNGLPGGNRE